ncbi:MAG: Gfo/Idh/MocA family oxidoreductase [Deltaproteobacteria bacterium]|uniref:Gfo/Idh/MocA family oxidoreductase n=1 Tax=Candidatus Zymogenus saltonus TaxID=2844893 RepID=A0A9D8PN26_9DELT|nr:Gfo/Idh/MocA family oxidoreductase [Candidatus Zymogenus saltonus]
MKKEGKEFKSRFLSLNPGFQYLADKDKYLFSFPEPKYRFNIIGAGLMGREHMKITLLEGRGTIHGIYDTNNICIEKTKGEFSMLAPGRTLKIYDSLKDACSDPDVDGLIISTPNYTHIDVVREAAKSGKHILLEKPMATTIPDAREIAEIAKTYKAVFQLGLQYRYKAICVEAIHEALVRKSIGDIKTINVLEQRIPFLDKVDQWNKFSKYSGGTLVEKCCHYFDLMNLFARSRPKKVFATGSMAVNFIDFEYGGEKSDIIDNAYVTVIYENGIRANFTLCMFSPMLYEEIILCGDEGRLLASENEDFLPLSPISRSKSRLEINCGELRPSKVSAPCYPAYIEGSGHNGATYYEHVEFVDNIEGKETNAATAEEGFWSIVVGAAAEESIKRGSVIDIDGLLNENVKENNI